jgi:hypothetical protein
MARRGLGPALITLDTSALFTLLNADDPEHKRVRAAYEADAGPHLLPAGILAEIAYLVEHRLGDAVLDTLLGDIEAGSFLYDCGEHDFPRIRELVRRYADLPLGCADACVIACSERNGGRVLTLDVRDFGVVAREGTIRLVPELT